MKAYVGIVISLSFILLVYRQIDLVSTGQILRHANVYWLLIALMFYWVEILLRILRWKRILCGVDSAIPYASLSTPFCVSAAANNIFPFRLGDILRAHMVGMQRKISRSSLLGTIILEKN